MSFQNFVPMYWEKKLVIANRKNQTALKIVNRNYEGLIANDGDRVKINSISPVTVSDYDPDSVITYSSLTGAAQWLILDKKKIWSCKVDDIDAAQSNVDITQAVIDDASYQLSDTVDTYIYSLWAKAGVTTNLGTTAVPLTVNSGTFLTRLAAVKRALDDAHCPSQNRFVAMPSWLHQKAVLAKLSNEMTTNQALIDGYADKLLGFNIIVSPNIATSGAATKVLAGTTAAITYADGLIKTEALRLQDYASDGLRGLHIFGATVVKADCLACLSCSEAAES